MSDPLMLAKLLKYDPRNMVGIAEQALPMITGAIAEPVAGLVGAYEAASGGYSGGARDAVREAMTYQPRTQSGKMYQKSIMNGMQSIMQSAPVQTWQHGVDVAGKYSPAAGALLQSVPTAIGVAAGAKQTLQAGRSVSNALDNVESFAPRMESVGIGNQAGVVNISGKSPRVLGEIAKKAYDLGLKHKKMMDENPDLTLLDVAYMNSADDDALTNAIYKQGYELSAAAYESGRRGAKPPTLATGMRYGKAPDSGFSTNKATGESEPGVSMAKAEGVDYDWHPVSDSKSSRKPFNYEGWLLDPDHFWGSDGEPLMIRLKEVKK